MVFQKVCLLAVFVLLAGCIGSFSQPVYCGDSSLYESNQVLEKIVLEEEKENNGYKAKTIHGGIKCDAKNAELFEVSYALTNMTGLDFVLLASIEWHSGTYGLKQALEETYLDENEKNEAIKFVNEYYDVNPIDTENLIKRYAD